MILGKFGISPCVEEIPEVPDSLGEMPEDPAELDAWLASHDLTPKLPEKSAPAVETVPWDEIVATCKHPEKLDGWVRDLGFEKGAVSLDDAGVLVAVDGIVAQETKRTNFRAERALITQAVMDPTLSDMPDNELALLLGCSEKRVSSIRDILDEKRVPHRPTVVRMQRRILKAFSEMPALNDRGIARMFDVSPNTVGSLRVLSGLIAGIGASQTRAEAKARQVRGGRFAGIHEGPRLNRTLTVPAGHSRPCSEPVLGCSVP
jgi:hypothetical protein